MNFTVTLDLFSGRPNFRWRLTREQNEEAHRRLLNMTECTKPIKNPPDLGYRGFLVEQKDEYGAIKEHRVFAGTITGSGSVREAGGFELWLLETGAVVIDQMLLEKLRGDFRALKP